MFKLFNKEGTDEAKLRAYAYKNGAFDNKKSAFDFFFVVEGRSIEDAEKLANILASARGIPAEPLPNVGIVDKVKSIIKQGSELANENPKITDFLIGLISGAASSLTGVAIGNNLNEKTDTVVNHEFSNEEPKEIENA